MYKVMIVDDEMLVRIGIKSLIDWQSLGFEIVAEAGNGIVAYEKYLAHKPDVVITDIKMPKKDGIWLASKIKEDNQNTEIIFLTCYDDFSYAKEAISLQVLDYILKAEMEKQELQEIMTKVGMRLEARMGKAIETKVALKKQQEYLLGLLLSGTRGLSVVKEEFLKANVPWNDSSYCFLQFDFRTSLKNEKNSKEQIANIVTACLEVVVNKFSEDPGICFAKQFGKSITCFMISDKLNDTKIRKEIGYLQNSIKQYFNIGFKCAYSPISHTIEEAISLTELLFRASDYLFYIKDGEYLQMTDMADDIRTVFSYDENLVKKLSQYVEEADFKAVEIGMYELQAQIDATRGNSFEVKLQLAHLANDILKRVEMYIPDDNHLLLMQKSMMDAESLEEVMGAMRLFFKALMNGILEGQIDHSDILVKKAIQYMQDHYAEKITLDQIANYVGLSKYYFSVLFKKEQSINFSSYLNRIRIEKAKEKLKNTAATVADIYTDVGFNDAQYFSKTFKKYTGMTITEYRNKEEKTVDRSL
ncbi:response regulator transcription factor [Lachnospiraceae bacterium LCP25S3_G4]